ncbi:MAG TPA: type I DNA topoisomerase [Micropepsaceae bacterium]|nr:type I DNA topoisomerase [Micropepsaceae bacterium]
MSEPSSVVVVESPAKAKTINKYLGRDYTVLASYGHVRDLPAKDGSVDPDADFAMIWEIDPKAQKRLKDIADALKGADRLILATDPDREGEAISWHVLEALKQRKALGKTDVQRVVFNAITKSAVLDAIAHPRAIDVELVDAYLARRALDYLVGFTLSPVLWRKLPGARSAGRVQSVALRLICDRELEIEAFKAQEYWTVEADFAAPGGNFTARLTHADGKKLDKLSLHNAEDAQRAVAAIRAGSFTIAEVEKKPVKRHPSPPFITSTLQQEASRKLGFAAARTMKIAQGLYEGVDLGGETVGLITYMRTDGTTMAGEAIAESRHVIADLHGDRYVPERPRVYSSKVKNAQEAHEAIRPTSFARHPERVSRYLDADQARLYELIWKRALASQMESAEQERTTADVASGDGKTKLRATGTVTLFDGFLKLYQEGRDDEADGEDGRLPKLSAGDGLSTLAVRDEQHFTEPPPRYSEASLVKKLEELGIGRPSTYASILSTLRDRAYVRMDRNRFIPEDKGRIVTAFLTSFFKRYVEYDFTADLEEKLDEVSAGELSWKQLLRDFWTSFHVATEETKSLKFAEVIDALDEILGPHMFPERADGGDPRLCPTCGTGRLNLKLGRFGAFIGCSNYPECRYTRQLGRGDENGDASPRTLGVDPQTGEEISLKSGRFGPYVQRGNGEKPARASIPKGFSAETMDLEKALQLLSLPREIGVHPETGKPIMAGFGRFGPYISHDGAYASLESPEDVFTVGINRAVTLLAERKANGGRGARGGQALKDLGVPPGGSTAIKVMKGRYGPYVTDGKINATLPRDSDPASVTLEEAVALIAARAEKGPVQKKGRGKKPAAAAKKAAAPSGKKDAGAKKTPASKAAKSAGTKPASEKPKRKAPGKK